MGGVVWTRSKILEAIDIARGPLDTHAVLMLASSMAKIGYDPVYPLLVWVNKHGERYIVDGRHRNEAAEERGLSPVEITRDYLDVEEMLAAVVRADETRRGYDPELAADRWAEIGIDLGTLRLLAGTDPGSAQRARDQLARERAERRQRKKEGVSRRPGRPTPASLEVAAAAVLERRERGEAPVLADVAREFGVVRTSLSDAVKRAEGRRKTDTSGLRRSVVSSPDPAPTPPAPEDTGQIPKVSSVPTTSIATTHTCGICEIPGQADTSGAWADIRRGTIALNLKPGGSPFVSFTELDEQGVLSLGKVHRTCWAKLSVAERSAFGEGS